MLFAREKIKLISETFNFKEFVSFGSICNINLIFSINEVKKMDL
jgi:hypothetical protein